MGETSGRYFSANPIETGTPTPVTKIRRPGFRVRSTEENAHAIQENRHLRGTALHLFDGHLCRGQFSRTCLLEGTAIIAVGVYFLVSRHQFEDCVLLVYTLSGSAGLILSYLLLRSGLVARWLSKLGIAGYAALLAGVLADMLGAVGLDTGVGIAFLVPGGLFEMAFPLLLIFRGWRSVDPVACAEGSRAGVVPGGSRG